jgi:SpoVK/Ycf46/Vps4 family AAA+-type ATPase
MANPLLDLFNNAMSPARRDLVDASIPSRTFDDVILPDSTRQALEQALQQIRKRELIFDRWGLGERHTTGRGLAFNFAGPSGTGKTICAEAIANALHKKLLLVRYSEMESLWAGETGKNVAAVFRAASNQDAVLFFDEADAIASRRFASVTQGYQRESNTVVNVLLKELEDIDGVVIFATNLAANFDPAFERRIRTHILFQMPGAAEREKIWQVQLHAHKTPLDDDVDFRKLAEKFPVSGGDIKNAVLKAAQFATAEQIPDREKRICQRHFEAGIRDVMQSKKVMEQTLFESGDGSNQAASVLQQWTQQQQQMSKSMISWEERVARLEREAAALPAIVERFDEANRQTVLQLQKIIEAQIEEMKAEHKSTFTELRNQVMQYDQRLKVLLLSVVGIGILAVIALVLALVLR